MSTNSTGLDISMVNTLIDLNFSLLFSDDSCALFNKLLNEQPGKKRFKNSLVFSGILLFVKLFNTPINTELLL